MEILEPRISWDDLISKSNSVLESAQLSARLEQTDRGDRYQTIQFLDRHETKSVVA
jgi:hypothetical protein